MLTSNELMTDFIYMIFISICSGAISWCYVFVLTKPGKILSGFAKFINKRHWTCDRRSEAWWYKILLSCEWCIAGQIALWSSILYFIFSGFSIFPFIMFDILSIMLCISLSMITISLLKTKFKTNI